jgi:hypothetical protein
LQLRGQSEITDEFLSGGVLGRFVVTFYYAHFPKA